MSAPMKSALLPPPEPGEAFSAYLFRVTPRDMAAGAEFGALIEAAADRFLDANMEFAKLMTRLTQRDFFVSGSTPPPPRKRR